jgi:hypothetical protein
LAAGTVGAVTPGAIGTGAGAAAAKTVGSIAAGVGKAAGTGAGIGSKVANTLIGLAGAAAPLAFRPSVPKMPGLAKEPSGEERARQARLAARLKGGGRSSTLLTGAGGAPTPTGGQKAAFGL